MIADSHREVLYTHGSDMSEARQPGTFRPDLEGLRGLAILLVLGFHAVLPGFGGGFVGVDVFFVLSGFLITGLLLREHERTGTVSLRNFYARRARRILPAAAVVLVLTLIASSVLLAPLLLPPIATDAASAALSVSNYRFASQLMDYFATGVFPSPFLHYWSLGVEEQFYLVWPALLILAWRSRRPDLSVRLVLGIVLVASLVGAVWLTSVSAPWAFYSLPTRAWQLALGGVLAALPLQRVGRIAGAGLAALAWAGLAAVIVGACVLIDASTPYPGTAAILPGRWFGPGDRRRRPAVLRRVRSWPSPRCASWAASATRSTWSTGRSWSCRPPRWRSARSCRSGSAWRSAPSRSWRAGSRGASWRSPSITDAASACGRRACLGMAGTTIAATAVFALVVGWNATAAIDVGDTGTPSASQGGIADLGTPEPDLGTPDADTPEPGSTPEPGTPTQTPGGSPGVQGSPSPGGSPGVTPKPTPTPIPVPLPDINTGALPRNIQPRLGAAATDFERLNGDGCEQQDYYQSDPLSCTYGSRNASKTVALVGDSTAGQWFPALSIIAKQNNWKIVTYIKFACRFEDIPQYTRVEQRPYVECNQWIKNVVDKLQALKPDLIVVAADRSPGVMNPSDDNPTVQGQAMARLLDQVPGARIALMVTTPQMTFEPPDCLSQHPNDVTQCWSSRTDAFGVALPDGREGGLPRAEAARRHRQHVRLDLPRLVLPLRSQRLRRLARLPAHHGHLRSHARAGIGGAAAVARSVALAIPAGTPTLGHVDHEEIAGRGPVLDRQERPPRLDVHGRPLVPSRVPETKPTPLQDNFIYFSIVVLICGVVAIGALELGSPLGSLVVKVPVLIGGAVLIVVSLDAIVRIWRAAWAWMPVDRGRGLFRLVWDAVLGLSLALVVLVMVVVAQA